MVGVFIHSLVCVITCYISHSIIHPYIHPFIAQLKWINHSSTYSSILWMSGAMFCIGMPVCILLQTPIMWGLNKHNQTWVAILKMSSLMSFVTMFTMMVVEAILMMILNSRQEKINIEGTLHMHNNSHFEQSYVLLVSLTVAFVVTFYFNYAQHKNHSK